MGGANFAPTATEVLAGERPRFIDESNWALLNDRQKAVAAEGATRAERRINQLLELVEKGEIECRKVDLNAVRAEILASPYRY